MFVANCVKKNKKLAELKITTDIVRTELVEANVQNEVSLLAVQEELRGARRITDKVQLELSELKEASTKQVKRLESDLEQLQTQSELK